MCEAAKFKPKTHPPLSLILWFIGITALMVALAHWA